MKLNIIKLLITILLFISAAFAFELVAGHIAQLILRLNLGMAN